MNIEQITFHKGDLSGIIELKILRTDNARGKKIFSKLEYCTKDFEALEKHHYRGHSLDLEIAYSLSSTTCQEFVNDRFRVKLSYKDTSVNHS